METGSKFLDHLPDIAREDVDGLVEAQKHYGDSWKKRGGVGAFMMLARKWDRLENHVQRPIEEVKGVEVLCPAVSAYDVFAHADADQREEGLRDDIMDLRRYLMLVEAEIRVRQERRKK